MKVSVVIPAYKEAENLDILIPRMQEALSKVEDYEINIIDTIEPMDSLPEVCKKYGVNYINRTGGNLYGDAIRTGFACSKFERIMVLDADGSHSPSDFQQMLNCAEDYDLTIGSRYIKNGKTDNPAILIFMSQIVNLCFRFVLGVGVKDISDSFRLYRTDDVKCLDLECSNFDIVEEIIVKLVVNHKNYKIREVPITFNKRMYGESKRDLLKFVFSYVSTLYKLFVMKKKAKRSLKNKKP